MTFLNLHRCYFRILLIALLLHSDWAQEAETEVEVESKNVALLRPAEQSSTFASGHASLAVDGSLETCSSTEESKNDYQRWWAVELPRAVNVKEVAVTINHDVAFHQQFTVFVIARSGDMRTKFHKCAGFAGILRAGRQQQLECPPDGIVGEKVYIRDDRREGTLSLCEVEVVAHSGGICSEPADILNGRHSVLGGTQQQLHYQCDPGFLLWGASDLVCLANNTWSSSPPLCSPITCGYPHVEDANAVIQKSSYNIEMSQGAQIGDQAKVVCAKNYQMLTNTSSTSVEAVDHVQVVCSSEGVWRTAYPYKCLNPTVIAKMLPSLDLTAVLAASPNPDNFSLHSIVFTLVSVVLFLVLCLLLTCLLRHRRMRAIKRRTEVSVTWPRNVQQGDATMAKSSSRPLISVFTTDSSSDQHQNAKKNSFGSSTASLVHAQHSGSSAKLIPYEDTGGTATIHVGRRYTFPAKKISYEDDFQLPDSGSLVQGVSVDPHSAVFGKHGQRVDTAAEKSELTGLPDVTASPGYYHISNSAAGFSTFQSPTMTTAAAAAALATSTSKELLATLWQSSVGAAAPPPAVTANETRRPSSPERVSLPSSDPGTRLFSAVRSLNDSVIMSPPEKFTNGELPELDEAGYASLILRTVKSDSKVAEPVYERIKGERSMSREILTTNATAIATTGSDSGESHAYYSRVAKDFSLEPPPLKEHLYQNFDQVFLAMEDQRQMQHPDLLESTTEADQATEAEQFYENTRSLSPSKEVVVNDEKLRYMYAQVDVIKKHFDRSNRAYQSLQVMDHSAGGHASPKLHEVGTIRTAWEEVL